MTGVQGNEQLQQRIDELEKRLGDLERHTHMLYTHDISATTTRPVGFGSKPGSIQNA